MTPQPDPARSPPSHAVRALAPLLHVADVERSLAFYALLGFAATDRQTTPAGRTHWAAASSGDADIMFAQADPDPDPDQQAIILYMYCDAVADLRAALLASGVRDGGVYRGSPSPRSVAFQITHPPYMPAGELRVEDPDGYVVLVGQTA